MGIHIGDGLHSGWNGKDNHLWAGSDDDGTFKTRSVVWFNIDFSGWSAITSATLKIYRSSVHVNDLGGPTGVVVSRMVKDWGEGDDVGEGSIDVHQSWDWNNRFDQFTTTHQVTKTSVEANPFDFDPLETYDVTNIVTDWFNGSANYGFMLRNLNEENSGFGREWLSFNSGDTNKPKLTIVYTPNTAPNAPTGLSPTGSAVVGTLTPVFAGTRSDDDSGDYISALQIRVFPDSASSVSDATKWDSGKIIRTGTPTTFSITYNAAGPNAGDGVTLVGNTFYKWAARTYDKADAVGPWSSLQRFKINLTPNAPTIVVTSTPTSSVKTLTPTFQVTHNDPDPTDNKMYGYEVIVEKNNVADGSSSTWNAEWDSGQADTSGAPVTTKTVTSASLSSWGWVYRVKARTKDANGAWSAYSGAQTFTLYGTSAPINLAPSSNALTSATPTFTGDAANNAVDKLTSYEIVVYSDDLSTTQWSSGTLTTGLSPDNVNGVSFAILSGATLGASAYHQWKVRATSSVGGTSAFSALQRFYVQDATVPTNSMPTTNDGTRVTTLTPAIVGSRASSFNRFKYEIYTDAAGTSLLNASGTLSSTIAAGGLGTQFTSAAYGGTALAWNTSYYLRTAVSSDAGVTWSAWTGLFTFTTDLAQTPALTTPSDHQWITSTSPTFTITRGGSDTIDKIQVRVWTNALTPILIWDSGVVDVTNASTGSTTFTGTPALAPGDYLWDARYQKTTGPFGNYAAKQLFHVNAPPDIPSDLFPTPSYVFADTLLPTFQAVFSDDDVETLGDTPSAWDIIVELANGTGVASKHITSSLNIGLNEYDWTIGDTTLSASTAYRFKTRFFDSLGVAGSYSGYNAFTLAVSPNGTITAPTNGSNINVVRPTVTWSYSGGTQQSFRVLVDRTDASGTVLQRVANYNRISAATSFQIPDTGIFVNDRYYNITLKVTNTDGLDDPSPSTVNVYVALDAPDPVTGLSVTVNEERSLVTLNWDTSTVKSGHTFVAYNVYRRLVGDEDFVFVGQSELLGQSFYKDFYAGNTLLYEYRVTMVATKTGVGIELESPDDPDGQNLVTVIMDSDVWMLVGKDRDDAHIQTLPVSDESHQRVLQQEAFETLGSNRKVIIRGFVLGSEGSITVVWRHDLVVSETDSQVFYDETVIGRRLLNYITNNKGPHILKSPFGDVWDVEFEGPEYQWMQGGNLTVQLAWTETGDPHGVNV